MGITLLIVSRVRYLKSAECTWELTPVNGEKLLLDSINGGAQVTANRLQLPHYAALNGKLLSGPQIILTPPTPPGAAGVGDRLPAPPAPP